MDPEETLELVRNGTIEPDQIDDFESLDDDIKELVVDGEISLEDAEDLQ